LSVPDRRPLTALFLAASLFLAAVLPAGAQVPEAPVIEPEAPATLLPLKIGDAGVDISLAAPGVAECRSFTEESRPALLAQLAEAAWSDPGWPLALSPRELVRRNLIVTPEALANAAAVR
jgi:hypothetical protein